MTKEEIAPEAAKIIAREILRIAKLEAHMYSPGLYRDGRTDALYEIRKHILIKWGDKWKKGCKSIL